MIQLLDMPGHFVSQEIADGVQRFMLMLLARGKVNGRETGQTTDSERSDGNGHVQSHAESGGNDAQGEGGVLVGWEQFRAARDRVWPLYASDNGKDLSTRGVA